MTYKNQQINKQLVKISRYKKFFKNSDIMLTGTTPLPMDNNNVPTYQNVMCNFSNLLISFIFSNRYNAIQPRESESLF